MIYLQDKYLSGVSDQGDKISPVKKCIFIASFSRALLSLSRTPETKVVISEFTLVTKIICLFRQMWNTYEATAQARQAREEQTHSLNKLLLLGTMETWDLKAGHRVNSDALTA